MIQRKQTIYLLISGLLMLAMSFVDLARITTSDMMYGLKSTGFEDLSGEFIPTWALFGLNALIVLLSFITIFLYNKRVIQMRLTVFNVILKLGFYALTAFYIYRLVGAAGSLAVESSYSITFWLSFPLIAIIFDYLAYRGIAVDERMVQLSRSGRIR